MNAKERLKGLQAALAERGVQDVKFCFSLTGDKPLSQVATEVADVVQAYINDKVGALPLLGEAEKA